MTPQTHEVTTWKGLELRGGDGEKIGEIAEVYLDRETGAPEWLAVSTGLFGRKVSFVPVREASKSGDAVVVPYDKSKVKDAPNVEADGELSREEERRLYEHYALDWGEFDYDRDYDFDRPRGDAGQTDDAMTRSEEELRVGKTQRETGRARLRKYVVTEDVQTTVPVQREEARIEREPITDANVGQATSGPEISEAEHEVTLHAEEPVVEKRAVPKERVRLDKDTVTEEEQVSDQVRKERVEAEGDTR
jgi:uncharacterized protein (TIGR02271 family)